MLINQNNQKIGFEFKYQDAPKLTKSMQIACEDLELDQLYVITPGENKYALAKNVQVMGLKNLLN